VNQNSLPQDARKEGYPEQNYKLKIELNGCTADQYGGKGRTKKKGKKNGESDGRWTVTFGWTGETRRPVDSDIRPKDTGQAPEDHPKQGGTPCGP